MSLFRPPFSLQEIGVSIVQVSNGTPQIRVEDGTDGLIDPMTCDQARILARALLDAAHQIDGELV